MKIKNVEIKNNLILGPMAGVTTEAFRTICLEQGAGLVTSEMISDKGLTYNNEKTKDMIKLSPNEHPISIQLFGSEVESMTEAAKIIVNLAHPDILDINMGCPVKKVVSGGAGSALLKTPDRIYDIVKSITDSIDIPVTAKIRTGWDQSSINCVEVAKILEKAGASMVAVHGRTRSQFYQGTADWNLIRDVKDAVSIPVVANGDIRDVESCIKAYEVTGADGIMVARAALGNPWIFKQISTYYETGQIIAKPSKLEVIDMLLLHATRLMEEKGEHIAMVEMRTHAAWYLKQLKGTKAMRVAISHVSTMNELVSICNAIKNNQFIN